MSNPTTPPLPTSGSSGRAPAHAASAGDFFGLHVGRLLAPVFIGISLVLAVASPGFDLTKHQLSLLLIGPWGWLESVLFVGTGIGGILTAVGVRRALGSGRAYRSAPVLFAGYGVFLIVAGVAHPDPQLGFPVGSPEAAPSPPSLGADVHSAAFTLLALSVVLAGLVLARRFAADGDRGWAWYGVVNSVAIVVLVVLGTVLTPAGLGGLPLFGVAVCVSALVSAVAWHLKGRGHQYPVA